MAYIEFNDITKEYKMGETTIKALDYETGKQILQDTCRKDHITVLLITHNSALAPMADCLIRFKNGKVTEITCNEHPTPIKEIEW